MTPTSDLNLTLSSPNLLTPLVIVVESQDEGIRLSGRTFTVHSVKGPVLQCVTVD